MGKKLSSWERSAREREKRSAARDRAADRERERADAARRRERERSAIRREQEADRDQRRRERERERRQVEAEKEARQRRKEQEREDRIDAARDRARSCEDYLDALVALHCGGPPLDERSAAYAARLAPWSAPRTPFVDAPPVPAPRFPPFEHPRFVEPTYVPETFQPYGCAVGLLAMLVSWLVTVSLIAAFDSLGNLRAVFVVGGLVAVLPTLAVAVGRRWAFAASEQNRQRSHAERVAEERGEHEAELARAKASHAAEATDRARKHADEVASHQRAETERKRRWQEREAEIRAHFERMDQQRRDVLAGARDGDAHARGRVAASALPVELGVPAYDEVEEEANDVAARFRHAGPSALEVSLLAPGTGVVPERRAEMNAADEDVVYKRIPKAEAARLDRHYLASLALATAVEVLFRMPWLERVTIEVRRTEVDGSTGHEVERVQLRATFPFEVLSVLALDGVDAVELLESGDVDHRWAGKSGAVPPLDPDGWETASPDDPGRIFVRDDAESFVEDDPTDFENVYARP